MRKKSRILFIILVINIFALNLRANEGMWIPLLLEQLNQAEMQNMGFRLTAEDIYSINKSSLKDAIVLFGGGCTAEIVSPEGLILTNHHCGYGSIQRQSTLEHDYLTYGFWAMNKQEELASPGLKATLLVRMEDVTSKVLAGVTASMREAVRDSIIRKNSEKIEKEAVAGSHYKARIKPFYYGNEFYLFITEVFTDIRLVGAPPSSIGKFGGDTDNWAWPRHTGDFSVFRIYANTDNKPADFSASNVPYHPAYFLPVSLKGINEGDFTMVLGYPGTTQEYLVSEGVEMITRYENPASIRIRDARMEAMAHDMDRDAGVRLKYSVKYAGIANYWKKFLGEDRGIKRLDAIDRKKESERQFRDWVMADPTRQQKYGKLLDEFTATYKSYTPVNQASTYFFEAGQGMEIVRFAWGFDRLIMLSKDKNTKKEELDKLVDDLKKGVKNFYQNYNPPTDRTVIGSLLKLYADGLQKEWQPAIIRTIGENYHGDFQQFADKLFQKSLFTSEERIMRFLMEFKASRYKKIEKDPAFTLASGIYRQYILEIQPQAWALEERLDSLYRIYMKALMEMQPGKRFYPDANLTMRVAYGKVSGFSPEDAVDYRYFTTLDGVMEKEDPAVYDYVVDPRLKELNKTRDFGRYADKDGTMHLAFIASNHTSGGNSGSPVINAEGQLIGINFDRNWEGTMSDLMYDPGQCRNISLDIRYCLFIMDKFAGAKHLVDEMKLVQ